MAREAAVPPTGQTNTPDFPQPRTATGNLVVKCPKCKEILLAREWEKSQKVCARCNYHFKLAAQERIKLLVDPDSFVEIDAAMVSVDPLKFVKRSKDEVQAYPDKIKEEMKKTGQNEAIISGHAKIEGLPLALAVMDFRFQGATVASVVGERIVRAIELGLERRIPVLVVPTGGGMRMQEGMVSLMQMAKTSAALAKLGEAGIPYFSLITDPTTGGTSASFAMLGDVVLAEPGALITFAGPRVIEQFMHVKVPEGTFNSEFVLKHGMIDMVVHRNTLRATLARLLRFYAPVARPWANGSHMLQTTGQRGEMMAYDLEFEKPLAELEKKVAALQKKGDRLKPEENRQLQDLERELSRKTEELYHSLTAWQTVQVARHKDRPHSIDYVHEICDDFFELCGDRSFSDDHAILGGLGQVDGKTLMFVCHQKGRTMKEKQHYNNGMPHPEGFRKASRLMRQAEKFGIPVVTLIDTQGAFPGLEDEERGQSEAIASNLYLMARLRVPSLGIVIGEGGSGGALAISVTDRILMMEHSIYTVTSPESAASILWRSTSFAQQAAEAMRITGRALEQLGIVDGVIPEPLGGAHHNPRQAAENVKTAIQKNLAELEQIPLDELLERRYQKYRSIGEFAWATE